MSVRAQEGELEVATPGLATGSQDEVSSLRGDTWRRLKKNRLAVVGMIIIAIIVLTAVFADVIASQDPTKISLAEFRQGPSGKHWFGTDELGRDIFARVVHGSRLSLIVGFSVV